MESNQITPRAYFNSLNILYLAMILGQVVFAVVALFMDFMGITAIDGAGEFKNVFLIVAAALALSAIYGNLYLFRFKLNSIDEKSNLFNKLTEYRSACILRWAVLEGPSFLSIIGYIITADILFLCITTGIIGYFILIRPIPDKTATDLSLKDQDRIRLLDPNAVIAEYEK